MASGLALLVVLLAVGTAAGLLLRARQGRTAAGAGRAGEAADLAAPGAALSIVQLSTPLCSRCPSTARLAGQVAGERDGVEHVELDLAQHPDLAGRFDVLSTPTLLLIDRAGAVRTRITGAPTRATLSEAVDRLIPEVP